MKKEHETASRTAVPPVACEVARRQGGAAGRLGGTGHTPLFSGWVADEMVFILPLV